MLSFGDFFTVRSVLFTTFIDKSTRPLCETSPALKKIISRVQVSFYRRCAFVGIIILYCMRHFVQCAKRMANLYGCEASFRQQNGNKRAAIGAIQIKFE